MANKPNNPSLWSKAKSLAKQKFDVYPSAYANGWAAKWYKSKGGTWRKAQEGMEMPYMAEGGKPEWLLQAQLKAQGYSGNALQQKLSSMAEGGEKMPAAIARARFAAAGNLDKLDEYGYAYGGYVPEMGYGGYMSMMQDGGDPDGEMALGQISAAIDKLSKLREFIQPDSDLEPWVNSKLTLLDHYTDAVSDYMMYNPEAQEPMEDDMEMMREGGIPQRYKNMGFNKVGVKKQSNRPGKKWMVLAKKGDQYKVVHGGYKGMQDFTQHRNENRRKNFWNRMGGKNSGKATDPFSPLYWHKRFGTWEDGGELPYDMGMMQDGGSIVNFLAQRGIRSDKQYRSELAKRYNVADYDFSAEKNTELLNILRSELKDAVPVRREAAAPNNSKARAQRADNMRKANTAGSTAGSMAVPKMFNPMEMMMYGRDAAMRPVSKNPTDKRNLESGTIVDKGTNMLHTVENGKITKSFPVLTGKAGKNKDKDANKNPYSVAYLEDHPELRSTPTGTYFMKPNPNIYGYPGFNLQPIPAFGMPAPDASYSAIHATYGIPALPGLTGHPDPAEFKRRNAAYSKGAEDRYMSFGCTNAQGEKVMCLSKEFPRGDTAIYLDSRDPRDMRYLNSVRRKEMGGEMPCLECGGMVPMYDYGGMFPQFADGGIYINPANKGKFTAKAKRAGMGVQEFAGKVLGAPEGRYSASTRKQANFARNASKWSKQMGGEIEIGEEMEATPEMLAWLQENGYSYETI